jgi:hypothetical protein
MTSFNRDLRSSLLGMAAVTLFQLVVLFAIEAAVVVIWNGHQMLLRPNLRAQSRRRLIRVRRANFRLRIRPLRGEPVAIGRLSQWGAGRKDLQCSGFSPHPSS